MTEKKYKTKAAPFNQRICEIEKKATAQTKKAVSPVAKDTNKTRRKMKKPTEGK